jgi:Tfp pilus assembly ATPase PilU
MSGQIRGRTTVSSGMEFDQPGGNIVPEMTADDLAQHLEALAQTTEDDRDQLLHDLLVQVYPTKATQDS